MSQELLVRKIKDGTVIDHIPAGMALHVLRILRITGKEGNRISIVINTDSRKLRLKDIVKIEGRELSAEEVNTIALIAPTATINIIRNYEVVMKYKVEVPPFIEGIVKCSNPNCITNQDREGAVAKFEVRCREPLILKCVYCERYTTRDDIIKQFSKL